MREIATFQMRNKLSDFRQLLGFSHENRNQEREREREHLLVLLLKLKSCKLHKQFLKIAFGFCFLLLPAVMMALTWGSPPATPMETKVTKRCGSLRASGLIKVKADGGGFPPFIPKEIEKIRDPFARSLAQRIVRLPVQQTEISETCIMSSFVKPHVISEINPVVLLHSFDSSCLEWRSAYPLLEDAGLEAWAIDVLGWGFSDLERLPPCNAASKRCHLYQLWKSYIKRPMILVGPSLGAAVAIDFAVNYPEAVEKMVLINPSVYAEGTGNLAKLPKVVAYAGVSLLKSFPLRLYANILTFNDISLSKGLDWTNVGRLHCHLPWWKDATVDFMTSGGYNVISQIKQVSHKVLIICCEHDQIVSNQLAIRLQTDLPNATMLKIPGCGHLPHVDKPKHVAKLIAAFAQQ